MFGLWPLEQIVEKRGYPRVFPGIPPLVHWGSSGAKTAISHTHTDTHTLSHTDCRQLKILHFMTLRNLWRLPRPSKIL